MYYPEPISKLIDSFTKLPGIGPKTAVRLAFFVLNMNDDDVMDFANALVHANGNYPTVPFAGILPIRILVSSVPIHRGIIRSYASSKIRKMSSRWKR